MFCRKCPKKLKKPAGLMRPAGMKKDLKAGFSVGKARAMLEQLWSTISTRGLSVLSKDHVAVLAGKAFFIPPRTWKRLYLPFKAHVGGGTTIALALQKEGLISGLSITRGGQLRVNVYNTTDEVVHLTPKTVMVNVWAEQLEIKYLGQEAKVLNIQKEELLDVGENLREEITQKYPKVGDFSTHPINDKLAKMGVRSTEIKWKIPPDQGVRTQYKVETVADRRMVHDQLQDYVRRGYLTDVSVGEDVYFNPLLPVRKPNGTFRFTNDFRRLNTYFPSTGETSQVDVWRKMWEMNPEWRYFMEIDLKDGFFGISVDEKLSKLFGFTYGDRRYRWNRLPQGWKWSSILFHERVAKIV